VTLNQWYVAVTIGRILVGDASSGGQGLLFRFFLSLVLLFLRSLRTLKATAVPELFRAASSMGRVILSSRVLVQ
jgi:hypothetical protein